MADTPVTRCIQGALGPGGERLTADRAPPRRLTERTTRSTSAHFPAVARKPPHLPPRRQHATSYSRQRTEGRHPRGPAGARRGASRSRPRASPPASTADRRPPQAAAPRSRPGSTRSTARPPSPPVPPSPPPVSRSTRPTTTRSSSAPRRPGQAAARPRLRPEAAARAAGPANRERGGRAARLPVGRLALPQLRRDDRGDRPAHRRRTRAS